MTLYKQCKTEQSARRQRQLEHGLLQMMQSKNYQQITVHELCEAMEIPRKTFYRYFPGKDDALNALIDHTLLEFEGGAIVYAEFGTRASMREITGLFEFWLEHRGLLDALERCGLSNLLLQRAIRLAEAEHAPCSEGTSRTQQSAWRYSLSYTVSGILGMIIAWHHEGYRETPREMALIALPVLTNPALQLSGGTE